MAKMTKIGRILHDLEAERDRVQTRAASDLAVLDAVIRRVRATQEPALKAMRKAKDMAKPVRVAKTPKAITIDRQAADPVTRVRTRVAAERGQVSAAIVEED